MENDFYNWYLQKAEENKGLVNPATAAKLIGISTQHLNRIVEMGRITKIYYDNTPFVGMIEVYEEIKRREAKEANRAEPNEDYLPFIYPKEELTKWLNELSEEHKKKKIPYLGGPTREERQEFLDKKLREWKKANPERAKKLADRLIAQIKGTYDPI